jgi:peptide/nickel transport system permease protein
MDMLPRLLLVIFIIAISQTAGMIRSMRAMLLDELQKQYVITARAKGVKERRLLWKYPIRMAINPQVSTIGWVPPGPDRRRDDRLHGSFPSHHGPADPARARQSGHVPGGSYLLIISCLTVVGTLISDILLAILDPRIKFGGVSE